MADDFMTGFVAGQGDNNNRDNGMFGGEGFMFLIVILALMGGNGFGGFGGKDGGVPASKSDLCDASTSTTSNATCRAFRTVFVTAHMPLPTL